MIDYTGNGLYCFTDSLHMCLRSAGLDAGVSPGLIECLGGMPFGAGYFRFGNSPMFFPSTPANQPDKAISQALWALGWACDETRSSGGDSDEEAIGRLRAAGLPAQVGPLDMGRLIYNPEHPHRAGADHYVAVLELGADQVRVHDPIGYPFAVLPLADFMQAWKAESIDYGPDALPLRYVLRANFRQAERLSRTDTLRRAWERIRALMSVRFDGPEIFSGAAADRALAADICNNAAKSLPNRLAWFALPLGARRCTDGAAVLAEIGEVAGAACMERKARLYGAAQYSAARQHWDKLAAQFESLAEVERDLVDAVQ